MRIFLRFSVGLFRTKTDRIQIQSETSTDELLETVSKRLNKPADSFTLTYMQEQMRVRIIKGWQVSHYNIRPGSTLTAELNEEAFLQPTDSMKTNKLVATLIPTALELSRVEELNEEYLKGSVESNSFKSEDEGAEEVVLRGYLDRELEHMLKEVRKGNIDVIQRILTQSDELKLNQSLISLSQMANQYKRENFINELGENGWAAIHLASYYEQPQVMNFLLEKHADPNLWTSDGWTPLQLAVSRRAIKCAHILVSSPRVKVNDLTIKGTALHIAAKMEFIEMVKLLMDNKANEHLPDNNGDTPIELTDNEEIKSILNREQNSKIQIIKQDPFVIQLPPILKGLIYRQNTLYQMKQLFFVCNPFQGTLIRYQSEQTYPRKPLEVIPLSSINEIKMVKQKQRTWVMQKKYHYFQIFSQGRLILGTKNERIAQRWVKGIFQASVFTIANQKKPSSQKIDAKDATVLVLDDDKNTIGNPAVQIRPRASSQSPKRMGSSNLLKQLSARALNSTTESPKKQVICKLPLTRALTIQPATQKFTTQVPPTIIQKRISEQDNRYEEKPQRKISQSKTDPDQEHFTPHFQLIKQNSESLTIQEPVIEPNQKTKGSFQLKEPSTKTTSTSIEHIDFEPVKVKFSSFELIKVIGSGAFGKVFEARLKSTGQVFALKALHKKNLTLRRGFKYAISQAEILKQANHPFIVKLHYTFQTMNNLYMCMDYCSNGDLSQLVAEYQCLTQPDTLKIVAQILLAIEYLHSKNIIYRDLKPQNLLLCEDGYIKLADFGLSKELDQSNSCATFCGSLAYLSPEMLQQKNVGKHTDIYGIGCVMYELLTGQPPYYDSDPNTLQNNIKEGKLKFSALVSPLAKQLILRFLQRDVTKRITIAEAKRHPFFKDLDFDLLLEKKIGQINFPKRQIVDSDDEEEFIKNPKPKFVDMDYPDNNIKSKVPNYSFAKIK